MFKKVLIANRGEIAIRIASTLQQMGIRAACVYAETDKNALHLSAGDEAYRLAGKTPAETYLSEKIILEAARNCGAEAIHPGYGFLSENPGFAQACLDAGLVFIGPSPSAIRNMGDKLYAKELAEKADVPTLPAISLDNPADPASLLESARQIGYPLLVKAAAGGGGKGMRAVADEDALLSGIEAARREALRAFGDDRVFLEKVIRHPRHIEFQILGDSQGHLFHLFERECSIQRRFQKIIEEAPASRLSADLRSKMAAAAVKIAEAAQYTSLGTIEFLLDESGQFYFLEMNTRLQVEHPVTELALQTDLIRLQVEVAAGKELSPLHSTFRLSGHALECRVYAEDPSQNFLPATGTIQTYRQPRGPHIRIDSGVTEGSVVTVDYDPMLAKVIVWGATRQEAIERMLWALGHYVILGIKTNLEFLQALIALPEFCAGNLNTHFIETHSVKLTQRPQASEEALALAAFLAVREHAPRQTQVTQHHRTLAAQSKDPWASLGAWRSL